jgi:hypothetical protein
MTRITLGRSLAVPRSSSKKKILIPKLDPVHRALDHDQISNNKNPILSEPVIEVMHGSQVKQFRILECPK